MNSTVEKPVVRKNDRNQRNHNRASLPCSTKKHLDHRLTDICGIEINEGEYLLPGLNNSFHRIKQHSHFKRNFVHILFGGLVIAEIMLVLFPGFMKMFFPDREDAALDAMDFTNFNMGDLVPLKKKSAANLYIEVDDVFGNQYVKDEKKKKVYDVDSDNDPRIAGAVNPFQSGGVSLPVDQTPNIIPEYTTEARVAGLQGTVYLEIVIDEQGQVIRARPAGKILGMGLDSAASKAFHAKHFLPARDASGKSVKVKFIQPVRFVLN